MTDQDKPLKFRDPRTGEVFEDIEKARTKFCTGKCSKCVLNDHASLLNCREYYSDSPAEAARLMGYEVVGETSTGEAPDGKPHICEVLGVEDMEPFRFAQAGFDFRINYMAEALEGKDDETGEWSAIQNPITIFAILLHPDRIIRKPRFTEEEVADAKVLARALLADEFERDQGGDVFATSRTACRTLLDSRMFPSLLPGQSVRLEDILEGT